MSHRLPSTMPTWNRPIRIPRHIDITHTDPPFAIAGERSTWRIPFKLSQDIPGGFPLKIQLWGGRNNKGQFPDAQVTDPKGTYIPSVTVPGKPFYGLVRPEDEFGNLSHEQLSDCTVSSDGQPLDMQTEQVPGSACLRVKLSLADERVHRLQIREICSGHETTSNPTICSGAVQPIYWGISFPARPVRCTCGTRIYQSPGKTRPRWPAPGCRQPRSAIIPLRSIMCELCNKTAK